MYDKENKILENLADINQDACEFYKHALDKVQSPKLERSFADLERLHSGVVNDLEARIRANGGEPDRDGTLAGKTARMFSDILVALKSDVDETLVDRLEEAEDRCLHSMREALDEKDMHGNTRALLISELGTLQRSHDYMKSLKDSMHS